MSSTITRASALRSIARLVAELQGAYDDRDRALAEHLGVGRTDLRCLDLLVREGPATAAHLAPRLHLTPGSMSALVHRLEAARYVSREDDPDHGRRRIVAVTPLLVERIRPVVGDRAAQGARRLARFNEAELTTIQAFLEGELART